MISDCLNGRRRCGGRCGEGTGPPGMGTGAMRTQRRQPTGSSRIMGLVFHRIERNHLHEAWQEAPSGVSDLAVIEPQRTIRCCFATLMMTAVRPIANSREHTILPSPIDYVQRSPVPAVESFQRPRSNLPESRTDRIGCVLLERTTGTRDHLLLLATRFSSDCPSLVKVHSRFSATIFAREAKF